MIQKILVVGVDRATEKTGETVKRQLYDTCWLTYIWYSSIASTNCPHESKSVPLLKLACHFWIVLLTSDIFTHSLCEVLSGLASPMLLYKACSIVVRQVRTVSEGVPLCWKQPATKPLLLGQCIASGTDRKSRPLVHIPLGSQFEYCRLYF